MTKYVQVYFRTEDEAEQLRATLSKFTTSNVMLDQLEENNQGRLVVPYVPYSASGTTAGNTQVGSQVMGFQDVEDDQEQRNIILSFEIGQDDLYDVLVEIQKLDGHVDRSLFD